MEAGVGGGETASQRILQREFEGLVIQSDLMNRGEPALCLCSSSI